MKGRKKEDGGTLHAHDTEAPERGLADADVLLVLVMQHPLGGINHRRHRDQQYEIHCCDTAEQLIIERLQKYIPHRTGLQRVVINVSPAQDNCAHRNILYIP